jgi:hypothetical protein
MWTSGLIFVVVVILGYLIYKIQKPKSKDTLIRGAMKSTKLSDFDFDGNPKFFEGLDLNISEVPKANLKILGRVWMNFLLHRRLVERLKFVEYIKKTPQLEKVQIQSPVFIVGLPRTGSTFLFNLLALDAGVQTLKLWELVYPVPYPYDELTEEKRIALMKRALRFQKTFSPQLDKIHYTHAEYPEEETLWFSQQNWFPGLTIGTSTKAVEDWFLKQKDANGDNALPMYQDFRNLLRMRQMENLRRQTKDQDAPSRWLFKGVIVHMHVLPALFRVFPDAKVIYLRRDPCEVVASAASLETEMGRHFQHINEKEHGPHRMPMLVEFEKSMQEYRNSLPKDVEQRQFLTVEYKNMVQNPSETVQNIYSHFNLDLTDTFKERIHTYLKENPQHKRGKHTYNLKKFGLTEDKVKAAFAPVYGTV